MLSSIGRENSSHRLGLMLVTMSAIAWSMAGLFTRLIELDTWTMLVWRGVFGALGMLLVIAILQGRRGLASFTKMGWPGWTFAIISAMGMLCFIFALRTTTVAPVSIIYATVPLMAAGLAWVSMREVPSRSAIMASIIALMGVAVMVGFGFEGGLLGDLLALAMTLSLAVLMVMSRRYQNIPTMPAACISALLSGLVAVPFSGSIAVSGSDLILLALFGLVNSAVGLSLFTLGARLIPAIETALIGALEAPIAPLWVWLAFAETPSSATMWGGAIVLGAVISHIFGQHSKAAKI